ncbi:unnamed protein product [Auanema sp. JU1783]|nr:unnamed protein product [Auanema sp. JU1783]
MRLRSRPLIYVFVAVSLYSFFLVYERRNIIYPKQLADNHTNFRTITFESYGEDFCVAYNVVTSRNTFREDGLEPISLATHTTATYLKYVIEQVDTYDGPISLAVYVDKSTHQSITVLLSIHNCDAKISEKISVHIVYRNSAFSNYCSNVKIDLIPCANLTKQSKTKYLNRLVPSFGIYPINVIRNIARRGSQSYLQIIADIEMIFSRNFAIEVKPIANKLITATSKQLIVVRRFELDDKIKKVPRTVKELKGLFDKKKVFEFHHKLFPLGHTIPGLFDWFRRSDKGPTSSWSIPYKGPAWEPQFIMHKDAPLSEELMPTRVRDHQALVYELCRANYKFNIISTHFNVHRGIKKTSTNLDTAVRAHQFRFRFESRKNFLRRIQMTYPDTYGSCRNFTM